MRSSLRALSLALLTALAPSCVYSHVKTTLDRDLDHTQLGSKVGVSHARGVLWLVAWGDAGTEAAAKQGGITTIQHADQEIQSILGGLYFVYTTIVYGD